MDEESGTTSIYRPENNMELAERNAGESAIEQIVNRHLNLVMDIRDHYPVNDADLLSSVVGSYRNIPKQVRQELELLHQKIRLVIEEMARRIEDRKYAAYEDGLQRINLGYNERAKVNSLLDADKKIHISYQSLLVAVETFAHLNKSIIKALEESVKTGDIGLERRLVLQNAVLVYELTDFIIRFIETFHVNGEDEINALYRQEMDRFNKLRGELNNLRKQAQKSDIEPSAREQTLAQIQEREKSIDFMVNEWAVYLKSLQEAEKEIAPIGKKMATLRLIRDNAKSQLNLLEAMSVMQIVHRNMAALDASILTIEKLELVSLSPDRVKRFIGLK
jgi:hypothetical protein